jgi:hypothetical protein
MESRTSTRRDFLLASGGLAALSTGGSASVAVAKLIDPKTVAEQLMYSTARIIGLDQNGNTIKTGSAFFYNYPMEGTKQVPVLITNKHVIVFVVHTRLTDAGPPNGNINIQSKTTEWVPHPDPNIDLCAILIGGVMNTPSNPRLCDQQLSVD